jgi:hypothetical protein
MKQEYAGILYSMDSVSKWLKCNSPELDMVSKDPFHKDSGVVLQERFLAAYLHDSVCKHMDILEALFVGQFFSQYCKPQRDVAAALFSGIQKLLYSQEAADY